MTPGPHDHQAAADARAPRWHAAIRRNELSPVAGSTGDADRRRSVREELDAAEERFPTVALR